MRWVKIMAKFFYRMQNILDIKLRLEDAAKQEYANAQAALNIEEQKLKALRDRKEGYLKDYQAAISGKLDFLKIEECSNAIDVMDDMIAVQLEIVRAKSREVEKARQKLARLMQERKMHEKLKEKKFEEFLAELSASESKETDEVVSYQYNSKETMED